MNQRPKKVPLPVNVDHPPKGAGKQLWYENGLRFKCTQSGNCCGGGPGYVWITDDDMARIAEHLKLTVEAFCAKYVRRIFNRFSLVEKPNYDCVFLTRENGKAGCSIYPMRPTQCRTWPFWDQNLKSPKAWTHAAGNCPGMADADAPTYPLEHIEKCRNHPESP